MMTKTLNVALKLLIAAAMMPASFVPVTANAAETCQPKKKCDEAVKAFRAVDGNANLSPPPAPRRSTGANQDAAALQQRTSANASAACQAQKTCEDEKKNCKKPQCSDEKCKTLDENIATMKQACTTNTAGAAEAASTQSATGASGGGGSNDMLMGGLMGAALGAGLMMMMNKKKEDEQQQQQQMPQMPYTGALQANGSIDCSKADALVYRDCNAHMENRCKTILDDPTCQQFSARYCGPSAGSSGGGATMMPQPQTPPGVMFAVDPATLYGATGEGVGSPYCRGVTGWNYCKAGGRESCPSCLQIQRNQSPACAQNPALCMAQNSVGEIEKAKVSCPTDPAFADPTFAAGGGAQVPAAVGGGLPAVVLPQSVGAGGAGSGAGTTVSTGGANAGSTGGISTQSANTAGGVAGDQGVREGYANGNSQAAYGGAGGSAGGGVGGTYNSASGVGSGGREFASASGFKPSSVSGPASDVQGQYAPSLFSTSSQVIRQRCQAGRLNNCP